MAIFNYYSISIIRFCAVQCARQHSGEFSVYGMVSAYKHALSVKDKPSIHDVNNMAFMIEPEMNKAGVRRTPITIDNIAIPAPQDGALDTLLSVWYDLSPEELWTEFQKLHPYRDGNGRIGAILYNMRRRTLAFPQDPPKVW